MGGGCPVWGTATDGTAHGVGNLFLLVPIYWQRPLCERIPIPNVGRSVGTIEPMEISGFVHTIHCALLT